MTVTLPQRHEECSSCPFAKRAVEIAEAQYGEKLVTLVVKCVPSGSAGPQQVGPGEWVEAEGRTMTLIPEGPGLLRSGESEFLSGSIPICPHYKVPGVEEKYPDAPAISVVHRDSMRRIYSYRLPPRNSPSR